ncbi:hypothetical protein HJFPF1_05792 [Paramyrothecium foliicola]|nr:hypothetical protein HJFPF1_05792 [Paramyrothecium foliicola]
MRVSFNRAAIQLAVVFTLSLSRANPISPIFRRILGDQDQISLHTSEETLDTRPASAGHLLQFAQHSDTFRKQDILGLDGWQLLKSLTVEKLAAYMRATPADLQDKCVFYTKAEEPSGPEKLSTHARTWASLHNKLSIWHLWPNKDMAQQDSRFQDFYSIDEEQSWLHSIAKLPKRTTPYPTTQYFENMSNAMARSCRGEVFVLTHRPEDLRRYSTLPDETAKDFGNIWGNIERPMLLSLYEKGLVGPFFLLDIRAWVTGNEDFPVYEYDIVTDTAKLTQKLLSKRSLSGEGIEWTDGVASEIQGRDYFAGWYSTDY